MDNNNINALLDREITRTLEDISKVKSGSEEAKGMLIKLEKLHGQRIKELEMDLKEKQRIDATLAKVDEGNFRTAELDFKVRQAAEDLKIKEAELAAKDAELTEAKKSRRWKTVLDILGIALPVGTSAWWMYKGLKFEEDGKIYSSRTAQWVGNLTRLFRKG